MQAPENVQPAPHWRSRLLVYAAIAIFFTFWAIQYSFQHGRLIAVAGHDDVGYFCDGAERLEIYYTKGWSGLVASFVQNPPHAPFSTVLATLSFSLFGLHDWAPYAGNGVLVFVLIAFTDWLLGGAALWLRGVGLALALSIPLTRVAVLEFRPDVAVALMIAMGVVMTVKASLLQASWRYRCLVGFVFGLAFLVKPTMCLLTCFMWVVSLGATFLCDWYVYRPSLRRLLGIYAAVGLVTILTAAPYFAWNGAHTASYIYVNAFGENASIWQTQASIEEHLLFYLSGAGARDMLDHSIWILGALLVVGSAYVLAGRRTETLVRSAALAFCILGAYTVPTLSAMKHAFFGSTFYFLLLFSALLALREICMNVGPVGRTWRYATSVALIGVALYGLGQPPRVSMVGSVGDARISTTRKTCSDLMAAMVAHRQHPDNTVVLTIPVAQYVNGVTLRWFALKGGHKLTFSWVPLRSDIEEYCRAMDKADLIVAFETEQPRLRFDSERLSSSILASARSRPHLVEVGSFPSYDGLVYYLFKNTQTPFAGWKSHQSLGPVEGPYPQWQLPRVRWGLGSQTVLRFDCKEDVPLRLAMSCRTGVPGQTMDVLLDGKEIHSQVLPPAVEFTAIDLPLRVSGSGAHELTLHYRAPDSARDSETRSVLFERLQLVPTTQQPAAARNAAANQSR